MTKENEVLEVQPVKLEAVDPKNEKHHIKGNIAYRVLKSLEFFDLSEFCDNVILVKSRRGWTGENPKTMVAVFVYAVIRGAFCSRIIASQTQWEPGFRSILGDGHFLEEGEITSFIEETGDCLCEIVAQVLTTMIGARLLDSNELVFDGKKLNSEIFKGSHTKKGANLLYNTILKKIHKIVLRVKLRNRQGSLRHLTSNFEDALKQISQIQKSLGISIKKRTSKIYSEKKGTASKSQKQQSFRSGVVFEKIEPQTCEYKVQNNTMLKFV